MYTSESSSHLTSRPAQTRRYDAQGNLLGRSRYGSSSETVFGYDARNRLTSRTTPLGTQVSMSYAPTGRRASATDARGPTRYGYDGSDRLGSLSFPDGRSLRFTYDAAGNLSSRTVETLDRAWTETLTYDAVGRPTSLSTVDPFSGTSYTYGMSYDGTGQLDALTYPNGLVVDYTYDALDQVTIIELESGSTVVRAWDYIRNGDGNISSVTETSGAATPVVTDYTYDGANRLITATQSQGASTLDAWAFEYDGAGNREEVTYTPACGPAQLRTAMYDARDRLLSDGSTSFTWDDDGRMLSRSGADGFSQLVWDAEDRLLRVVHGDGTVADSTYDVDGVLMQSDVAWPTGTSSTTRYLVDTSRGLSHIVADIDLSPGTGPGVTETTYARVGDMLLGSLGGAGPRFTHGDHLGSVRAVSDASGSIVGDYRYSPYGLLEQVQGEGPGAYRFAGERFGPLGVLSQNRARWMDPRMGAFLSIDPWDGDLSRPGTLARLGYVAGRPTYFTDPTGKIFITAATLGSSLQRSLQSGATVQVRLTIRKAGKKLVCIAIEEVVEEIAWTLATEGLYVFLDSGVLGAGPYVGETGQKLSRRLGQHTREARRYVEQIIGLFTFYGTRSERRVLEQRLMSFLEDELEWVLTNLRNPEIPDSPDHPLRRMFNRLDFCD